MFKKSFKRPKNFFKLSARERWEIDDKLGILGWKGTGLTTEEKLKFNKYYK